MLSGTFFSCLIDRMITVLTSEKFNDLQIKKMLILETSFIIVFSIPLDEPDGNQYL